MYEQIFMGVTRIPTVPFKVFLPGGHAPNGEPVPEQPEEEPNASRRKDQALPASTMSTGRPQRECREPLVTLNPASSRDPRTRIGRQSTTVGQVL